MNDKTIAVYGAAYPSGLTERDERDRYDASARFIGKHLATNGYTILTGACAAGGTATLTTEALKHGGKVVGVLPIGVFEEKDVYEGIEIVWESDFGRRLDYYAAHADAHIALPGGIGTINEIMYIMAMSRCSVISVPTLLISTMGYYTPLLKQFERMRLHGWRFDSYDRATLEALESENYILIGELDDWLKQRDIV